jgi:hypothetical protein
MKLLVLVLTFIGISALGGAIGMLDASPMFIAPALQRMDPASTQGTLLVLSFLYAMSALVAAYGAWRRATWTLGAYAAFATLAAAFLVFFLYIAPVPKDAFFFTAGPGFLGLAGWGFWKGWATLKAELKRA